MVDYCGEPSHLGIPYFQMYPYYSGLEGYGLGGLKLKTQQNTHAAIQWFKKEKRRTVHSCCATFHWRELRNQSTLSLATKSGRVYVFTTLGNIYIYTYTRMHTGSMNFSYVDTDICTHTYIYIHTHVTYCTYVHTCTHMYIQVHTGKYIYIHVYYTGTYTHIHTCMHACMHAYTYIQVHACTYRYIHVHTGTYIDTYMYVHTCVYIYM